jgi:deoxyribonuclease-4
MSTAGGVDKALERGASIGCSSIQIFLKNNMQWSGPPLKPDEIARFRQRTIPVFAHSGYLLNLASPDATNRQRSIAALVDELERATALGVPFIVMHPGAHMGAGEETGLRTLVASLDEAFAATGKSTVQVALETTAGQGTCLGHRFEHLAYPLKKCRRPSRLAVCVDTCHIFAAGYDIRTPAGYKSVMAEFDHVIGHQHVVAFHLNDSKKPLGSRVDRHEHIGRGLLGLPAFRCVLHDARWAGLPMALETPKSADLHEDVENLRVLRSLC